MALSKPLGDFSQQFNSVYNVTLDLSGWDKTAIQVVAPFSGQIAVLATNDSGAIQGVTQGNAELATNFVHSQVKDLTTLTSNGYIYGEGLYEYTVNARFLKLQGIPSGAGSSVYKLLFFNSKIA